MMFERNAQGEVPGLLRFTNYDGLPFNVDLVHMVFSTERIDSVEEMLEDVKAWDALYSRAICRSKSAYAREECEEEADITDALAQHTRNLKL